MNVHPHLAEWRESNLAGWKATDLPAIDAPELRHHTEAARPMVRTSTGLLIGAAHRPARPAHYAHAASGPHRRPGIANRALAAMGSMRAFWIGVAAGAALVLLSACGPSDTEALQDMALDLDEAQAEALLAARLHK